MGFKIFNFACANGHLFEGWFADDDNWRSEAAAGRFVCPVCASVQIEKRPAAPNFGRVEGTVRTDGEKKRAIEQNETLRRKQAAALAALREAAADAEDVGERFASTVRSMKAGSEEKRLVKGRCSDAEASELLEEGIPVMPLPDAVTKPLN